MLQSVGAKLSPSELVWINGPYPVVVLGLTRVLEEQMRVYTGQDAPGEDPSSIIYCTRGPNDLSAGMKNARELYTDIPILVFGMQLDLGLAQAALRLGARGFIHAGMTPDQIVRAVTVASEGELVAPRELLTHMLQDDPVHLSILTSRQQEILAHVAEGLSNAQIAQRLFLSESTIKQHLRAAYKSLGVNNRTEAAKLFRAGEKI
ncbi:MAG: response regulator transcription factor [Rubrobacteraceae bacterium]